MKQRLAESFETALRLADGRALAVEMDSGVEHVYSSKFACPICGYSLQELEPRLFSFNNPMGACPRMRRPRPHRILRSEAHRRLPQSVARQRRGQGLGPAQQFYFQMLSNLAEHYEFDIDTPFEKLPEKAQQVVLYGSGNAEDSVHLRQRTRPHGHARACVRRHGAQSAAPLSRNRFDGGARRARQVHQREALPELRRRAAAREARNVKVGNGEQQRAIYEVAATPLRETLEFFETLKLTGSKKEIADASSRKSSRA